MCPGIGTTQCDLGMAMCPWNGTGQGALGRGLSNVPWEWDYPMCPGYKPIQCALGMGQAYVLCKCD